MLLDLFGLYPVLGGGRLLAAQRFGRENAAVPGVALGLLPALSFENTHCTMNIRNDRTVCSPLHCSQCLASKG